MVGLPAWQAITPEAVPRAELQPAVTLSSVAVNIARAVGPAVGGVAVALAGVFYGSTLNEAPALRGEGVVVVGAGDSAGQAAVHLSRFARRVTPVARGESLAGSMSHYLVDQVRSLENVSVLLGARVVDAAGSGRLEQVTLAAAGSGARQTVAAAALFVLIGTEPRTEWLGGTLERDETGFILTGRELHR